MIKQEQQFDLAEVRRKFPLLVENLASLPNREAWLTRIWEIERRWEKSRNENGSVTAEVFSGGLPKDLKTDGDFEIIYAGGTLGLLHASVMSAKYNRKVLVFDAHTVGKTHRDW